LVPDELWLAFMIVSLLAFILIVVIIVLTLVVNIEGIFEVFPSHAPVAGAGP
jgi:hypothetical protein